MTNSEGGVCGGGMMPPILELRPSRLVLAWLVAIHGLALLAVFVTPLGLLWRLPLTGLVVLLLAVALRRELGRTGIRLVPQSLREWELATSDGRKRLRLNAATVFRPVVILMFADEAGDDFKIHVGADVVPPDTHRRLRAALKAGGLA